MPTARELLDQADALMRRNRLASAPATEDGIPTLTDAIAARAAESLASAEQHTPAPRIQSAANPIDDVPLLTDAVEEIEAPSILEEPPDVDDPAMWTDTLTGAHTIIPAVPLEVPREGDHAQGVGVLPEEWGEAAPHPGPALAVETIDIAAMPDPAPERPVGPDAAAPPPPLESFPVDFASGTTDALPMPPPPPALPLPLPGQAAGVPAQPEGAADDAQAATPFEWPVGEAAAGAAAAPKPAPAGQASSPEEEARWSALAEEVRMQVLQRIDLFTDTGLREQLSARLQPIVDRASADLVATINQHVGVLLRAYVAEAIEREIERWRADGR